MPIPYAMSARHLPSPQRRAFITWSAKSTALELNLLRLYAACDAWRASGLRKGWCTWQAAAAESLHLERMIGYLSPDHVAMRKALNTWSAASERFEANSALLQRACIGLSSRLLWGFNGGCLPLLFANLSVSTTAYSSRPFSIAHSGHCLAALHAPVRALRARFVCAAQHLSLICHCCPLCIYSPSKLTPPAKPASCSLVQRHRAERRHAQPRHEPPHLPARGGGIPHVECIC